MKIVFIQNNGGNYGGVWQVNKLVGEALIKDGYEVSIVFVRDDHLGLKLDYDKRLEVVTINSEDVWGSYYGKDFKESLKKFHFIELFKQINHRLRDNAKLKKDKQKLNEYLDSYQPDYIVSSQYQVLDLLDKKYLPITFHEQHCSFRESWSHKGTRETLLKYNNQVKYIWLCKTTLKEANNHGLNNNYCIYNAVRFTTLKRSCVRKNKKLICIARLSLEKRFDKMINYIEEIFKDSKYKDWSLEIYGSGDVEESLKSLITSSQVKLMGRTDKPMEIYLESSINLCTSDFEGFSLSILEASECGIPTVTLDFGESCAEQVIDGKTGFITKDKADFIKKLKYLMDNPQELEKMSINNKEYIEQFKINNIVKDWEELFKM